MEADKSIVAFVRIMGDKPVLILHDWKVEGPYPVKDGFVIPLHGDDAMIAGLVRDYADKIVEDSCGKMDALKTKVMASRPKPAPMMSKAEAIRQSAPRKT